MKGRMQHVCRTRQCPRQRPAWTPRSGGGRVFAWHARAWELDRNAHYNTWLTPRRNMPHSLPGPRRLDGDRGERGQKAIGLGMDCVSIHSQFDRKILEMLGNSGAMRLQNRFLARPNLIKGRKQRVPLPGLRESGIRRPKRRTAPIPVRRPSRASIRCPRRYRGSRKIRSMPTTPNGKLEIRPMGTGQAGLSVRSFCERDLVRCNARRLAQKAAQRPARQGEQCPVLFAKKMVRPVLFAARESVPRKLRNPARTGGAREPKRDARAGWRGQPLEGKRADLRHVDPRPGRTAPVLNPNAPLARNSHRPRAKNPPVRPNRRPVPNAPGHRPSWRNGDGKNAARARA